jgi:hypothetical protein
MSDIKIVKADLTIKILLTAIAIFLGVIAVSQMSNRAEAQGTGCGTANNPCYVKVMTY